MLLQHQAPKYDLNRKDWEPSVLLLTESLLNFRWNHFWNLRPRVTVLRNEFQSSPCIYREHVAVCCCETLVSNCKSKRRHNSEESKWKLTT